MNSAEFEKYLQVVAAVVFHEGRFLCVRRGSHRYDYLSGKFEFPGGKVEIGESQTIALEREMMEELNMKIIPLKRLLSCLHHYPDFSLEIHFWLCHTADASYELREHQSALWMLPSGLEKLDWAAADVPVLSLLRGGWNQFLEGGNTGFPNQPLQKS